MAKRALVTLTTDFGTADPYVGALRGNLLRHCPHADIVDITHDIPAHQVLTGAFVLAYSAPFFPKGTLHVIVVDPTVGTDRPILLGQFGGQLFLFPDNGVISMLKDQLPLEGLISIRNQSILKLNAVSHTFHGRDLFAPIAGYILNGGDVTQLGPTPSTYKLLDLPQPTLENQTMLGWVVHIDRFGNLITNITADHIQRQWEAMDKLNVECRGKAVANIGGTYAQATQGDSVALINSMGLLEIAVNQGRADEYFQAGMGAKVRVRQQAFLEARPVESNQPS